VVTQNEIAAIVVDAAYKIHTQFGPGLLEPAYTAVLSYELTKRGLRVAPVHHKQLLTYLRLADKRLGLLINLSAPLIRDGITRVVNGLPD
jgi:hypothetical protein